MLWAALVLAYVWVVVDWDGIALHSAKYPPLEEQPVWQPITYAQFHEAAKSAWAQYDAQRQADFGKAALLRQRLEQELGAVRWSPEPSGLVPLAVRLQDGR